MVEFKEYTASIGAGKGEVKVAFFLEDKNTTYKGIKKPAFFKGKEGETFFDGKHLLIGLGKAEELDEESLRKAAAIAINTLRGKAKSVEFLYHSYFEPPEAFTYYVTEGAILASFRFSLKEEKDQPPKIYIAVEPEKKVKEALREAKVLANANNYARWLANMPPNIATPEWMVEQAKKLAKEKGLSIKVYDKKALKKMGANAILAVNAGSGKGAYIVVLEYKGKGPKVALAGKGITFDSGGLGIKPGKHMLDMKMDKSGAAVVLGILKGAAELRLPYHIKGYLGLTENMPGQNAYKPGDVITALNGKKIEIQHTDAEGRVVLADVLSLASKEKPQLIIDFATLTGAMFIALGEHATGMFTNDEELVVPFMDAGEVEGEMVWPFPLTKDYEKMVESKIADVKNIGSWEGEAGSITAAAFLKAFVGEAKWAHFDIASSMERSRPYYEGKGFAAAPGVRFTLRALLNGELLSEM